MRVAKNVFAFVLVCLLLSDSAMAQDQSLGLNDVSWLWPVPESVDDLDDMLSMGDLPGIDGNPAWSDSQFQDVLNVVAGDDTEVEGFSVTFDAGFSEKANWFVAGMRIDPTAPGAHANLRGVLGSDPQIRLIVQPVTKAGAGARVHDTAVHLVYSFKKGRDPENPRKIIPDNEKFAEILDDIRWLKAISRGGGVSTNGALGVHPGLKAKVPGLSDGVKRFLSKHLAAEKLDAIALAGINGSAEPWIFLALTKVNGKFVPIPKDVPFAKPQMINFLSGVGVVAPDPVVSNLSAPGQAPQGVATSVLFSISSSDLNEFATIGNDKDGNAIRHNQIRNRDIADVVANPNMSNFFNTDCNSCHTESQRRSILTLPLGDFAFKVNGRTPEVTSEVASTARWNVRSFGWFPDFFRGGTAKPTATLRTANESAEVLEFIEEHFAD